MRVLIRRVKNQKSTFPALFIFLSFQWSEIFTILKLWFWPFFPHRFFFYQFCLFIRSLNNLILSRFPYLCKLDVGMGLMKEIELLCTNTAWWDNCSSDRLLLASPSQSISDCRLWIRNTKSNSWLSTTTRVQKAPTASSVNGRNWHMAWNFHIFIFSPLRCWNIYPRWNGRRIIFHSVCQRKDNISTILF